MNEKPEIVIPPIGSKLQGIVCRFIEEGALLDIGNGILGLLSNREISFFYETQKITCPLKVGDKLQIRVKEISHSKVSKIIFIRLTLKNTLDMPTLGSRVNAKVIRLSKSGAHVLLETGVKTLIHISEIFWDGGPWPTPDNVLTIGDWIEVIAIYVNNEKGKTEYSYRQAHPNTLSKLFEKISIGDIYKATVVKFTRGGGLIVKLENGFRAFIPSREISWTEMKPKAENYFQLNQKIEIIISAIDLNKNTVAASFRLLLPNPWSFFLESFPIGTLTPAIVTSSQKYGFFLTLPNGFTGLLHNSKINQELSSIYVGVELFVKILSFDNENRKISFTQL